MWVEPLFLKNREKQEKQEKTMLANSIRFLSVFWVFICLSKNNYSSTLNLAEPNRRVKNNEWRIAAFQCKHCGSGNFVTCYMLHYLSLGVSFKTQRRRVIEINADRPEGAEACQRHWHEYAECCAASLRPPENALAWLWMSHKNSSLSASLRLRYTSEPFCHFHPRLRDCPKINPNGIIRKSY